MISTLCVIALLIAPSPTTAESLPYHWLATSELETLLRGSRIIEADNNRPSYMRTPEIFSRNGHHARYADNYEHHGKYSIRNGAVCDQAMGEQEVCRHILVDKDGRYWIVGRENPSVVVQISVIPLR